MRRRSDTVEFCGTKAFISYGGEVPACKPGFAFGEGAGEAGEPGEAAGAGAAG